MFLHTDQTTCYDADGRVIPCSGPGPNGATKRTAPWPEPRFALQGDTVTDRLTGLIWTKDAGPGEFPLTWQEALGRVMQMNEARSHAGHADWRLPNRKELFSLVSHSNINPVLPAGHPFANVFSGYYWTSTTCARLPREAWYVHLGGGRVFRGMKQSSYMAWPVRGPLEGSSVLPCSGQRNCFSETGDVVGCAGTGQDGELQAGIPWPDPRFVEHEHTVLDRVSQRMWAKSAAHSPGPVCWASAIELVKGMNVNGVWGYNDWRLPNIRELESLVDLGCHTPALTPSHPFTSVLEGYWSSTTSAYEPRYAWVLYMMDGGVGVGFKVLHDFFVWPVRNADPTA